VIRPFSLEEVQQAIKGMKTESAPSPDGFLVIFYKFLGGGGGPEVVDYANDG
jgi:hypothetical protein